MRRRVGGLEVIVLGLPLVAVAGQAVPPLAVDPEPVLAIGEALAGPLERSFTDIAAIGLIGDSILVLEGGAKEIRVFDREGTFLGRIGGEGEGPGEFMWPTAMRLTPDGIEVVDLQLRRQSFFSPRGELLRTEPLGRLGDQALAGSAALRGAVVRETAVRSDERGAFPEQLVILTYPDTPRVDTIARYSTGYVPFRTPDSYGFLDRHVGSQGDWAVAGDSLLVVVSGEPFTLRWWRAEGTGLAPAGRMELPVRPEPFTRDDARDILEETNEARRAAGSDRLLRSVEMDPPSYWGQVKQLVISDERECWIQWDRPRSSEDDEWFRVDLESGRLGRVSLPPGFRMLAATGEHVYGFVLTEYDVPVLTMFRLRPGLPW